MPRCEGLPDGLCPNRRNDGTVRLGEGDLMLSRKCDNTRHQAWLEHWTTATVSNQQQQSRKVHRFGVGFDVKVTVTAEDQGYYVKRGFSATVTATAEQQVYCIERTTVIYILLSWQIQ